MAMSTGRVVALIQAMCGGADPAVIKAAVQDWLDAHPEATTTVQDGSITEQKLAAAVAAKINQVSQLSDEIDGIGSDVTDLKSAFDNIALFQGNLYNIAEATQNKIILDDNTESSAGSTFWHTGYIPVIGDKKYVTNTERLSSMGLLYDSNKTKVATLYNISYIDENNHVIIQPTVTGYIRLNFRQTNKQNAYICELEQFEKYNTLYDQYGKQSLIEFGEKFASLQEPSNLYNKDGLFTRNTIVLNDGTTTGNGDYDLTDYIEVDPGVYSVSYGLSSPGAMYDENKNFIYRLYELSSQDTEAIVTFIIPNGIKYVRLNVYHNYLQKFIFSKGEYLSQLDFGVKMFAGERLSSNLYDKDATGIETGQLLLDDGSKRADGLYSITDYILIPGLGNYTVPYAFSSPGCLYNSKKQLISRAYTTPTADQQYTFTISDPDAKYIRLNMFTKRMSDFFLYQGNESTGVPYKANVLNGIKIKREDIIGEETLGSRWNGKRIVCFGDSRTWYDGQNYNNNTKDEWKGRTCIGYQKTIEKLLGCQTINQGVSGENSIEICTRIRAYDFTGADAVLLEGGVNDWIVSPNADMGAIAPIGSTFDTTTVYGAWQSAVEYIMTNYPSVSIYIVTPCIAWAKSSDVVFPYSIAEVKKNVAELYNLPCKDMYKEAGITVLNRDYFYVDNVSTTYWRLHFNDLGNAWLGGKIAEFINVN